MGNTADETRNRKCSLFAAKSVLLVILVLCFMLFFVLHVFVLCLRSNVACVHFVMPLRSSLTFIYSSNVSRDFQINQWTRYKVSINTNTKLSRVYTNTCQYQTNYRSWSPFFLISLSIIIAFVRFTSSDWPFGTFKLFIQTTIQIRIQHCSLQCWSTKLYVRTFHSHVVNTGIRWLTMIGQLKLVFPATSSAIFLLNCGIVRTVWYSLFIIFIAKKTQKNGTKTHKGLH